MFSSHKVFSSTINSFLYSSKPIEITTAESKDVEEKKLATDAEVEEKKFAVDARPIDAAEEGKLYERMKTKKVKKILPPDYAEQAFKDFLLKTMPKVIPLTSL